MQHPGCGVCFGRACPSSCLPRAPSALLISPSSGVPQVVSRHLGSMETQNPASRANLGWLRLGTFHRPQLPQVPAADPKATCSLTRPERTRNGELDIHHAVVWIRELEKPPPPALTRIASHRHGSIDYLHYHGSSSRLRYLIQGGLSMG